MPEISRSLTASKIEEINTALLQANIHVSTAERNFVVRYAATKDKKTSAIFSGLTCGGMLDPDTAAADALSRGNVVQALDIVERLLVIESDETTRESLIRDARAIYDMALDSPEPDLRAGLKAIEVQADLKGFTDKNVNINVNVNDPSSMTTEQLENYLAQRRAIDVPYKDVTAAPKQIGVGRVTDVAD